MFPQSSAQAYQMPRQTANYHLHHEQQQQQQHQALLQQQLQVFHHFQAFQRHQERHQSAQHLYSPLPANNEEPQQVHQLSPSPIDHHDHHNHDNNHSNNKRSQHPQTTKLTKGSSTKPKRIRTIFTPEQLKRLEYEFNNQMYLVGQDRCFLADSLNLSEAQVKVWFQNRRIKHRKLNL